MARRTDLRLPWLVLKRTITKFFEDNGPFLASGLAFDLLLYCIPLSLLIVSLVAYGLASSERALAEVHAVLQQLLPGSERAFTENLSAVITNRGLVGLAGFITFFIFGSTTFGSVRIVLNTVFEVERPRSFLRGKLIDFLVMLSAGLLVLLTIGAFSLLAVLVAFGERLPLFAVLLRPGWALASGMLGFLFTTALFYVLYRFSPAQTLRPRGLLLASGIGAGLLELSKWIFTWYVSLGQERTVLYGALGGLIFFILWLYYASVALILGAEAGIAFERGQAEHSAGL